MHTVVMITKHLDISITVYETMYPITCTDTHTCIYTQRYKRTSTVHACSRNGDATLGE